MEVLLQVGAEGPQRRAESSYENERQKEVFSCLLPQRLVSLWQIFTAEEGEAAGLISTAKAGRTGRCF